MSVTGIPTLDHTLSATKEWLKEVREELRLDNEEEALKAIGAVLQALRDRLTVEEAVDLAAQLPMLLQGVYYQRWQPVGKPLKLRSQQEFYQQVAKDMGMHKETKLDPQHIVPGVFRVLEKHISRGEIADVKSTLPAELLQLWPQAGEKPH